MRVFKLAVVVTMLAVACLGETASNQPVRMDQVIDRVVQQEQAFMDALASYNPLVETYIQEMRADKELGLVPERDQYFLSKADFNNGIRDRVFVGEGAANGKHAGKFSR